jgi:hypothetical protein
MDRYRREVLHVPTLGIFRKAGKDHPKKHILPADAFDKNILASIRQEFWRDADLVTRRQTKLILGPRYPRDNSASRISLHPFFHHLTSSQAMCFNLFYPFIQFPELLPALLQALLGETEEVAAAEFEHVHCKEEGTNFDFYLRLKSDRHVFIECKFTEPEFGKAEDNERHRTKFREVYLGKLQLGQKLRQGSIAEDVFFTHYQLYRNIAFLNVERGDRLVLVYPEDRSDLDGHVREFMALLTDEVQRAVDVKKIGSLVTAFERVQPLDLEPFFKAHWQQFRQKYLPDSLQSSSISPRR